MDPEVPNRMKLSDGLIRLCMVMVWDLLVATFFLHYFVVGTKTGPRANAINDIAIFLDILLLFFVLGLIGHLKRNYRFRFSLGEILLYITIIAITCVLLRGAYFWVKG